MKKYLKIYMFATVLLSDFLMFAQDPGTDVEDEYGNTDGSVEGAAPINGKLLWLAIAGIIFSFYYFKKMQKSHSKYAGASESEKIE